MSNTACSARLSVKTILIPTVCYCSALAVMMADLPSSTEMKHHILVRPEGFYDLSLIQFLFLFKNIYSVLFN